MIPYGWGTDPGLCSGAAEQDLAYYEDWLERAIWDAMTGGQGGNLPRQDDAP